MVDDESRERLRRLLLHGQQVEAGLIPTDSPPFFVRPESDRGRPWWFGPDWQPTLEAIEEFSEPTPWPRESQDPIAEDPG